jgi:hypothetical protein
MTFGRSFLPGPVDVHMGDLQVKHLEALLDQLSRLVPTQ